VFSLSSLAIIWLALVHRQLVFDLEDKERERQILAREIEHRSKNLVAVIGSMVRQTVSNKTEADALLNRMHVVASGDDLLEGSKPRGLRELLEVAVCRAAGKQVILNGQDVRLTSDQARSLALVFHEMTTNALKYGALSKRDGRVTIDWTRDEGVLSIKWCEVDGPAVSEPAKFNFGSKLITSMLKQIGAELNPTFAETGYCYRISIPNAVPREQADCGATGTIGRTSD
jgi:two-component sensor histidine kinase